MRDQRERLLDIMEAVERIERQAERGRKPFERDELIQVWIVHHLQIIGEAAAKLGSDFHSKYPQLPWKEIVAMRNVLVHDYFGVDTDEVWRVVERDLPVLKREVQRLLGVEEGKDLPSG